MSTSDFLNSIGSSVGNAVSSLGNMMTPNAPTSGGKSRNYKKKATKAKKPKRGGTVGRLSPNSARSARATKTKRSRTRSRSNKRTV
jgi:hypothetical protein